MANRPTTAFAVRLYPQQPALIRALVTRPGHDLRDALTTPLVPAHQRPQAVVGAGENSGRLAGQPRRMSIGRRAVTAHAVPLEHGLDQPRVAQRLRAVRTRPRRRRRAGPLVAADASPPFTRLEVRHAPHPLDGAPGEPPRATVPTDASPRRQASAVAASAFACWRAIAGRSSRPPMNANGQNRRPPAPSRAARGQAQAFSPRALRCAGYSAGGRPRAESSVGIGRKSG